MPRAREGDRAARALAEQKGEAVSFHVGEVKFIVLDGRTTLPLATKPIKQDQFVLHAVHQKVLKNYASGTPAVLVVQLHSPAARALRGRAAGSGGPRPRIAGQVRGGSGVDNNYGDPPVKIPA